MRLARRLTTCAAAALGALALLALPGAAAAKDGNHDRIPDRWERHHHLSTAVNQAGRDQDHDRLRNRAEFLAGDNPRDRDSDDDGVMDGDENAGTITAFDAESGKLTIGLFNGDSVSGLVTEGTRIKCEDEHSPDVTARARHGEEEPGDDRGEGEEAGDDNGGQGEEPGGDNGGDNSGPGNGGEDNSGPGSSHSGRGPSGHDDNGTGANCTTSDLILGATVEEAELELEHGVATFEEVELAG
ncbi:MAG TPA: hypothetical protein VH042_01890 [Solirubrobacterales bacterium]|jgi:hypothetical protein|nr:hypothetical protein [Solirubrobacterales bacterium]